MNPKVPDYGEDFPVMTQFTNISEGGGGVVVWKNTSWNSSEMLVCWIQMITVLLYVQQIRATI